ncbi:MAG: hypothetical protein AAGK02_04640 [Pseudomonadota bacterium]
MTALGNAREQLERARTIHWKGLTDYYSADLWLFANHARGNLTPGPFDKTVTVPFGGKMVEAKLSGIEDLIDVLSCSYCEQGEIRTRKMQPEFEGSRG